MADNGWQRKFEDPIPLPDGRKLVTLRDAADYITGLPKKESDLPEWQTAIEVLMLVSRSGPTMMARIGVMKPLSGGEIATLGLKIESASAVTAKTAQKSPGRCRGS